MPFGIFLKLEIGKKQKWEFLQVKLSRGLWMGKTPTKTCGQYHGALSSEMPEQSLTNAFPCQAGWVTCGWSTDFIICFRITEICPCTMGVSELKINTYYKDNITSVLTKPPSFPFQEASPHVQGKLNCSVQVDHIHPPPNCSDKGVCMTTSLFLWASLSPAAL